MDQSNGAPTEVRPSVSCSPFTVKDRARNANASHGNRSEASHVPTSTPDRRPPLVKPKPKKKPSAAAMANKTPSKNSPPSNRSVEESSPVVTNNSQSSTTDISLSSTANSSRSRDASSPEDDVNNSNNNLLTSQNTDIAVKPGDGQKSESLNKPPDATSVAGSLPSNANPVVKDNYEETTTLNPAVPPRNKDYPDNIVINNHTFVKVPLPRQKNFVRSRNKPVMTPSVHEIINDGENNFSRESRDIDEDIYEEDEGCERVESFDGVQELYEDVGVAPEEPCTSDPSVQEVSAPTKGAEKVSKFKMPKFLSNAFSRNQQINPEREGNGTWGDLSVESRTAVVNSLLDNFHFLGFEDRDDFSMGEVTQDYFFQGEKKNEKLFVTLERGSMVEIIRINGNTRFDEDVLLVRDHNNVKIFGYIPTRVIRQFQDVEEAED